MKGNKSIAKYEPKIFNLKYDLYTTYITRLMLSNFKILLFRVDVNCIENHIVCKNVISFSSFLSIKRNEKDDEIVN